LKKVQGKKKRDTAAADLVRQAAAEETIVEVEAGINDPGEGANLLNSKDEDVIF